MPSHSLAPLAASIGVAAALVAAPALADDGFAKYDGSAAALVPDVVTEKYGERRAYFGDWLASCRPTGYCAVLTYLGAEGDFFDNSVRVGSPLPGADYDLLVSSTYGEASNAGRLTLKIDNFPAHRLAEGSDLGWAREPLDASNERRVSQSVANLDIIPEMRRGYRMTATWPTENGLGTVSKTFSLRGLQAALHWIDVNRWRADG